MPYYDRDGRELSGQYDSSASGNWVYTDGGAPVESARGRDLRFAASERSQFHTSTPPDQADFAFQIVGFLLFTLPIKLIHFVVWSMGCGWRSGRWSYRRWQKRSRPSKTSRLG